MSYRKYLEYVHVGVEIGLDRVKGYFGPNHEYLVEFEGSYEHFTNPIFTYGWRPLTKKEFYNKPHDFKKKWANK